MTESTTYDIAIIGAGSWGTALAILTANNGHKTVLWSHQPEHVQAMQLTRTNEQYLPGIDLPENITVTADLKTTINSSKMLLVVVPSHAFGEVIELIKHNINKKLPLFWATKGFEPETGKLLHEVVKEKLPDYNHIGIVTGPSFAKEVALGLPTAVTVASESENAAQQIAQLLHCKHFRTYITSDVIGAEIGGAVKNVLAIAIGICDGLSLGTNARAGLITRGMNEIIRLGKVLGAQPETLMGLAGLGDLVLTCTGDLSRNRRFGLALSQGKSIEQATKEIGQVVEGIQASQELHNLAHKNQIEMPIATEVYQVINHGKSITDSIDYLLSREMKHEAD